MGGNTIDVTYDGDDTNLHAIWDTQIPEAISGGSSMADAKVWASTLTTGLFHHPLNHFSFPFYSFFFLADKAFSFASNKHRYISKPGCQLGQQPRH